MPLSLVALVAHGGVFFPGEMLSATLRLSNSSPGTALRMGTGVPPATAATSAAPNDTSLPGPFNFLRSAITMPSLQDMFGSSGSATDNPSITTTTTATATTSSGGANPFQRKPSALSDSEHVGTTSSNAQDATTAPIHVNYSYVQVIGRMTYDAGFVRSERLDPLKAKTSYVGSGVTGVGGSSAGGVTAPAVLASNPAVQARSRPCTVFSTPPSILFTDEDIPPDTFKEFQYSIPLPSSLPPSYRGKSIRFDYYIVVGVQTGDYLTEPLVADVTFRMLTSPLQVDPYDILDPIVLRSDEGEIIDRTRLVLLGAAKKTSATDNARDSRVNTEDSSTSNLIGGMVGSAAMQIPLTKPTILRGASRRRLMKRLDAGNKNDIPHASRSSNSRNIDKEGRVDVRGGDDEGDDEDDGMANLSILARVISQGSGSCTFTIGEGDNVVANLVLLRSKWRLGETVSGVLDLRRGTQQCHHCSMTLEFTERLHADFHGGIEMQHPVRQSIAAEHRDMMGCVRTGIALPLPEAATPSFRTSIVALEWAVRVRVVLRRADRGSSHSTALVRVRGADPSGKHFEAERVTEVASFECVVPLTVLGARTHSTIPLARTRVFAAA